MAGQSLAELPSSAIRLICSGQVITSIYSVVKELAENSFDANCTSLDVKLEGYGLEKIEVCDSGCGIKNVDVPFVARRHYTSKLVSTDDLQTLQTYGFRGEALASLCAVSDVSITTKTAEDDISYIYDIDIEGNITGKKPSHLGKGTTVTARNLFSNLPVRKQLYNTSQRKKDDLKRIEDLLIVFGIIRPHMRITLRNDRDIVWQKMPTSDTKGSLQAVLSRQVFNQLLFMEQLMTETKGSVSVYLPKPGSDVKTMSRSSGDKTFIVVNDRPVHIKELVKVLKQYYTQCHACEATRFPVCYVCVKLPASDVDVNIDPNKTTVLLKYLTEVRICLEELLLKVYGPLDNVPNWHYSDAVKTVQDQNDENVGSKTLLHRAGKTSSVMLDSERDMRDNEMSEVHKANPASNIRNETVGDRPTPLPMPAVTFSNSESASNKTNEVAPDSEHDKHRKTDDYLNAVPKLSHNKFAQSVGLSDDFSRDMNTENSNNHLQSSSFSRDVFNKESGTESLDSPSTSENVINICGGNRQSDITEKQETSDINNSHNTRLDQQNQQKCLDMENALNAAEDVTGGAQILTENALNAAEDVTGGAQILTENALNAAEDVTGGAQILTENDNTPKTTCYSWSMGHGITSASGKQLQPVQLLTPSSRLSQNKRQLSTNSRLSLECPPKQRKISADVLPPGQSTMNDMFIDQPVKSKAYELFCEERRPLMLEADHDENMEAVDKQLAEAWKNLSSEERLTFRQKCLENTRQDQTVTKGDQNDKARNSLQLNGGDDASAKVQHKKAMKRRLYHLEKKLECDTRELRAAVLRREAEPHRLFYETPTVIGRATSCDVWLCGRSDTLCVVNVCRLGEAVLLKNLREKHRLLIKSCQSPVNVGSVLVKGNVWSTLEQLAQTNQTEDTYFHISDERLVANGFDVLCHRDCEGRLQAELVGLCDLVPEYNISDLSEVLQIISRNPSVTLGDARSTKVLYYLQGEVYRILQKSLSTKSVTDVQEMVDQLEDDSDSAVCIHHRPVFHNLFDLSEIKVPMLSCEES